VHARTADRPGEYRSFKIGSVARKVRAARPGQRDEDELLALTLSRPREALAKARMILRAQPSTYQASVAHQAAGIVLREFGDVDAGIDELRKALRLARRTGSVRREAEVLASLAVALVYAGRTAAGLSTFDRALQQSSGAQTGAASRCWRLAGMRRPWATRATRSRCCGGRVTSCGRHVRWVTAG